MRFEQIRGLTSLPVDRVRRRFRNEEVLAVVPASVGDDLADSLLIATASALVVVTADPRRPDGRWMTAWHPWDAVQLSDGSEPWMLSADDEYQLFIRVGSLSFESLLRGDAGRRVLRDFVVAAQSGAAASASATGLPGAGVSLPGVRGVTSGHSGPASGHSGSA